MKRVIVFLLGLVVVCGMVYAATENILINPGFDSDDYKWRGRLNGDQFGWGMGAVRDVKTGKVYWDGTAEGDISIDIDKEVFHSGTASLKIQSTKKPYYVEFGSKPLQLKGKQKYEIYVWAKADKPDLTLRIQLNGSLQGAHWYRTKEAVLNQEWQKVTLNVTTPEGIEKEKNFIVCFTIFRGDKTGKEPGTGTIWLDDVFCGCVAAALQMY
ncbi:MAG: carbohydrate binding domain-containing protein [Planctomycetes bacterium]|nr:carbohydrate binding domain-containing protein [Planctomycetota bacterium]